VARYRAPGSPADRSPGSQLSTLRPAGNARRDRDQITYVARGLFLADDYAATTVAAIAATAHVSVETIYKALGGKPGLVRAIIEKGLAREGPVPAEQRSEHNRDTEPDPRRILAAWGASSAKIGPGSSRSCRWPGTPPPATRRWPPPLEQISAARHERMTVIARGLAKAGTCGPAPPRATQPTSCGPTARARYQYDDESPVGGLLDASAAEQGKLAIRQHDSENDRAGATTREEHEVWQPRDQSQAVPARDALLRVTAVAPSCPTICGHGPNGPASIIDRS
jgi:AcrR family transcriptional regulator